MTHRLADRPRPTPRKAAKSWEADMTLCIAALCLEKKTRRAKTISGLSFPSTAAWKRT